MLQKLKEFKNTLSERIRSPFIGSLLITWSLLHWQIYILLFYNQDGVTLDDRINKISSYIENSSLVDLIWKPIGITFIALIAYSILNSLGLSIKLLYDNWLSPYIQKLFFNNNIIEKGKYLTTLKAYQKAKEELINKEETYRDSEDNLIKIRASFQDYTYNSIPTRHKNINEMFDPEYWWSNNFTFPGSKEQNVEYFHTDFSGIKLESGEIVQLKNAKESEDGHILIFEKHFDDKRILKNYLIKDKTGNYYGFENNDIAISYIKSNKLVKP